MAFSSSSSKKCGHIYSVGSDRPILAKLKYFGVTVTNQVGLIKEEQ
jgi:hypothetical protein